LVDASPKSTPYKHLVTIRPGVNNTPIFFVHERSGNNVTYHHVADHIDQGRPVYGLNFNWPREAWDETTPVRDVALAYANEIQDFREKGPYYLVGLSIGGQIAFEIGSILAQRHEKVIVFMIDTYSPKHISRNAIKALTRPALISLRQAPFSKMPQIVYKKISTLYREFILPELNPKTKAGAIQSINIDMDRSQTKAERIPNLLRNIRKNHQPVYFPGTVCYFRALQTRSKVNLSYKYWRSFCKDFKLFEEDCRHSGFVEFPQAIMTASQIVAEIKRHEIET
jgi:thioesterase domain-containing protein